MNTPPATTSRFDIVALETLLRERAKAAPETSYTARLARKGIARCAQKLGEEAVETVIAALGDNRKECIAEVADLLYHLLVVLVVKDIPWQNVVDELERRAKEFGHKE